MAEFEDIFEDETKVKSDLISEEIQAWHGKVLVNLCAPMTEDHFFKC